jgi:hypothetical protein
MQQRPVSCWQCGTVVSAEGGRCPACGAEQLPGATPSRSARPSRPHAISDPGAGATTASSALLWVALIVLVAAIVGAAVLLGARDAAKDPPGNAPLATAIEGEQGKPLPTDVGAVNLRAVDPMEVLGRAKTRALSWSKDAVLVSMRARPVASGRVDVQGGGSVEYWFAKPTGEGFGPGMKVAGKRLHISLESTGTKTEETAGGPARAALEPNCPLDAAAHAAQAAGIAQPLVATYEMTDRVAEKPTWRIATDGKETSQRQIDGLSCAVLVR